MEALVCRACTEKEVGIDASGIHCRLGDQKAVTAFSGCSEERRRKQMFCIYSKTPQNCGCARLTDSLVGRHGEEKCWCAEWLIFGGAL